MLIQWECLEEMDKLIEQWIVVDAIITDPPYWTTACKWDSVIPFEAMWERLNKLIKPNWAIALFGSQPYSSALVASNFKWFRYQWMWDKVSVSNPQLAKRQPLKHYEDIIIFSVKPHNYYPQWLVEIQNKKKPKWDGWAWSDLWKEQLGHIARRKDYVQTHTNYPKWIIKYPRPNKPIHPTQKPVALMEYLIKTYSLENEIILDFTAWSWSTWLACQNTNRKFIWIELDENYYNIAKERLFINH